MERKRNAGQTWLIVDGYNIIGAWSFLTEKSTIQDARDALKDILLDYCGYQDYILLLVFDAGAIETPIYEERLLSGKVDRIVFTEYGQTADQYIERFVRDHEKQRMIVASSDQLIQVMIFSRAIRMSARELYIEIEESRKSIEAQAEQLKKTSVRLDARIQEDIAQQLELWRLGQYVQEPIEKPIKKIEPIREQKAQKKESVKNTEKIEPPKKKRRRKKKKTQDSNKKEHVNGKSKNNDPK